MSTFGDLQTLHEEIDHCASDETTSPRPPPLRTSRDSPQTMEPLGVPTDEHSTPTKAPPSDNLVRVCPPASARTRRITNDDVSLFSDFARYLDERVDENCNAVEFNLTCLICHSRKLTMNVPFRDKPEDEHEDEDQPGEESLLVFPCGHFVGEMCYSEWIAATCEGDGRVATCPLCRAELVYSCTHDLVPRMYNPLRLRSSQVPMTLPEGGVISNSCEDCQWERIDAAVDTLRHLLFPPNVQPGNLRTPEAAGLMYQASALFKKHALSARALHAYYISW